MKLLSASTLVALLVVPALSAQGNDISVRFYEAIRTDDFSTLQKLIRLKTVNARDKRGTPPLMYAAAIGSVRAMKLLLGGGADPNAKNDFDTTALIWGAGDIEKVRLLIGKGADVNARSKLGRTALMTAAYHDGSSNIVKLLVAKGADVLFRDQGKLTALEIAAGANDINTVRFLLANGADPRTRDAIGFSPLFLAAMNGNPEMTRLLLAHGADATAISVKVLETVKNGPFSNGLMQPLHETVAYGGAETVRVLIRFGGDAKARDIRGMTPLTLAVSTDRPDLDVIRLLRENGADPHSKSTENESAIDWARKFRNPEVLAALGAPDSIPIEVARTSGSKRALRESVEKSVALLQRTGVSFLKEGGCFGCHSQNLTGMAVRAARDRGIKVDEAIDLEMSKGVVALRGVAEQPMLQLVDPSGAQDTMMFTLFQMSAARVPPGRFTDATVHYLAAAQHNDGRWTNIGEPRPPIQDGDFYITAMGLRSLQLYGIPARKAEFGRAIQRAAMWLRDARPRSTSDRVFQLLGLQWSAGTAPGNLLHELLAMQQMDGGWAQTPYLSSDAYATGQVLYALHELGVLPSDTAYRRAVEFLLNTQEYDGSWHVRSRSPKIQPYFESGFPYGHDQWISSAATAWAAMALSFALPNKI